MERQTAGMCLGTRKVAIILWLMAVLNLAAGVMEGAEYRVLLVGDSWAQAMWGQRSLSQVFTAHGYGEQAEKGEVTAIGGTPAAFWNSPTGRQLISSELSRHVTIDCVHLSTGEIDLLTGWNTALTPEQQTMFFDGISANISGVIQHCLKQRPTIGVVICGYDYLNLQETVAADPNGPVALLWERLGRPTARELNGALAELEKRKEVLAAANPRVCYVNNLGLMQKQFGYPARGLAAGKLAPPGDPNLPSPPESLANGGRDGIHLRPEGYLALAENCFVHFYQGRFLAAIQKVSKPLGVGAAGSCLAATGGGEIEAGAEAGADQGGGTHDFFSFAAAWSENSFR